MIASFKVNFMGLQLYQGEEVDYANKKGNKQEGKQKDKKRCQYISNNRPNAKGY